VRRRRLACAGALVAAVAFVATGCTTVRNNAAPVCAAKYSNALALVAQAVPTADRIPCIASYPAGWNLGTVHIRKERASFALDNDRGGISALRVNLERSCDVTGATQVPTDEPGTLRYARMDSVDAGLRGVRFYVFPGGCVTYQFRFKQRGQALVNEASVAVGFVTRSQVDDRVREETGGRSHL
jgi:hypothetical protein